MRRGKVFYFFTFISMICVVTTINLQRGFCTNDEKAIEYIKTSSFVYRNISATYMELSITYAFTYENPKFIGWHTASDPDNPAATLVTMKFSISGASPDILNAPESKVSNNIKKKMKEAVPMLKITWRIIDLIQLRITPYNFYAEDALAVYKEMVDGGKGKNRDRHLIT